MRWLAFKVHGGKKKSSTAALARNHVIEVSNSGLVSLMGGKWTAYRIQGEQTVDRILKHWPNEFKHRKYETGQTLNFNLIGSYGRIDVIEGISWGNEALYKQVGDNTKGGETIAAAGNSGGNMDSGLYFEIRYQGVAFDPLAWVGLR